MSTRILHLLVAMAIGLTIALPAGSSEAAPCWEPPVAGRVIDPFRRPACPWCPGNRGLEYAVGDHVEVRAVAGGVVAFSGVVADLRYVVVRHVDGRRTTYGRLTSSMVERGDVVIERSVVGRATGRFYFGVRVGDTYVDPQPLLGRPAGPPRLVPVDGSSRRPVRPDQVRCVPLAGPPPRVR